MPALAKKQESQTVIEATTERGKCTLVVSNSEAQKTQKLLTNCFKEERRSSIGVSSLIRKAPIAPGKMAGEGL